ncbi:MAG TPA: Fur family transcriptional regulator [bacterium]|nr:Fur family transcriptional regulator [bacterium]
MKSFPRISGEKMMHFEKLCRERGVPLTVQRRAILESLAPREDHPTADQVFEDVAHRLPGLSRTTVYRVLETLVEMGVIHKANHLGSAARYDPNTERHHHLTCLSCHKVMDVEDGMVQRVQLPKAQSKGFEIRDYSVHFKGYCPECLKKGKSGAGGMGHSR